MRPRRRTSALFAGARETAYRVGDSSTNFLTPRMPHFPPALSFCHRYAKCAGIGTPLSKMPPYALVFWAFRRSIGWDRPLGAV
jgi:p-aminobenzoyl-glutamate transporter AbgT